MPSPRITAVHPHCAIDGGRITLTGSFSVDQPQLPDVRIGGARARVVFASSAQLAVIVPSGLDGGRTPVEIDGATVLVDVATTFATGLHQVDNPVFDLEGNLYVTYSGTRKIETGTC